MYKITIIGTATASMDVGETFDDLEKLDGTDCQDDFTEYFNSKDEADLIAKGVRSGYMHFTYNPMSAELETITTYESDEELTESELQQLIDYTTGQWSDGIGEGFEQQPCAIDEDTGADIYISPGYYTSHVMIKI